MTAWPVPSTAEGITAGIAPLDALIREVNTVYEAEPEDTTAKKLLQEGLAHLITGRLLLTGEIPVMAETS